MTNLVFTKMMDNITMDTDNYYYSCIRIAVFKIQRYNHIIQHMMTMTEYTQG